MLVIRKDNHYDYVDDVILDSLIKSKDVIKLKRNSEWVTVEPYSMRGTNRHEIIKGTDRLAINDSIFVREYYRGNQLAGHL